MSSDIQLIIEHHDNPCGVMERVLPRFAPFDLRAALELAWKVRQSSRLVVSVLNAAANSAHKKIVWQVMAEPGTAAGLWSDKWGSVAPTRVVPMIVLRFNGRKHPCVLRYLPRYRQDVVVLEFFNAHLYALTLCHVLESHGAERELGFDSVASNRLFVAIPIDHFYDAFKALEHAILSEDIVRYNRLTDEYEAGPLMMKTQAALGRTDSLLSLFESSDADFYQPDGWVY